MAVMSCILSNDQQGAATLEPVRKRFIPSVNVGIFKGSTIVPDIRGGAQRQ